MDNLPSVNSAVKDSELAKLNSMGFSSVREYQLYLSIMKSVQQPVVIGLAS